MKDFMTNRSRQRRAKQEKESIISPCPKASAWGLWTANILLNAQMPSRKTSVSSNRIIKAWACPCKGRHP